MLLELLSHLLALRFDLVVEAILSNLFWVFALSALFFLRFDAKSVKKNLGYWIFVLFFFDVLGALGKTFIARKDMVLFVAVVGTALPIFAKGTKLEPRLKVFTFGLAFLLSILFG